jgi:hypothetical protein
MAAQERSTPVSAAHWRRLERSTAGTGPLIVSGSLIPPPPHAHQ